MVSDLSSFLSKKQSGTNETERCDLIVSNDKSLVSSIVELYVMEGFPTPKSISVLNESNINGYTSLNTENVVLDLRGVDEFEQLAIVTQMGTLLDMDIMLMILSDVNSIVLQNEVYRMGAIYVLWDEELSGLGIAITSKRSNSIVDNGSIRRAKRILVIGTRGGVGVSTFSSILSHALAVKANLKVLISEHDMHALSSDACLGISQLKLKQNVGNLEMLDFDAAVAQSYVHQVHNKLDYLAIDSHSVTLKEHTDLLYRLSHELTHNYNFIVDSVPLHCLDALNLRDNIDRYHRIFVICEPSVASLRAYNSLSHYLNHSTYNVVFNFVRQRKDYLMSVNEAAERVKINSFFDVSYEPGIEKIILQQGLTSITSKKYFFPYGEIIKSLTGKNIQPRTNFKLFRK